MNVIDFETHPIEKNSPHSPKPVGVAIRWSNGRSKYLSWGHPCNNNSTYAKAKEALAKAIRGPTLYHNAQFDVRILNEWFDLHPQDINCTKILAFIKYPDHWTLSLKPLSEEFLGMPPDEQDEMHDWLREHYKPAKRTKNPTKYTAFAPGDLAGAYAVGDVERTWGLWRLWRNTLDMREQEALYRETATVPLVIDMERHGVRIDRERLAKDLAKVELRRKRLSTKLFSRLGDINLGSRQQLADSLEAQNLVGKFKETPSGERAVGIPALRETCSDQKLVDDLELYSKIGKLAGTYMRPWLEGANGRFYPYINPTRVDGESGGTRTGRFSSDFQQVPKRRFGKLPYMRDYVLPDEGHVIIDRDYSQQEYRILANYAGGDLLRAYVNDPDTDMHDYLRGQMRSFVDVSRDLAKMVNFLIIYGGGANKLATSAHIPLDTAYKVKAAHAAAAPEVKELMSEIEGTYESAGFIRSWGGRKLRVPPGEEYKLLNKFIQGSAADQTKDAMIRFDPPNKSRIMLQVHDELLVSAPKRSRNTASEALRQAMEFSDRWLVPMRTDVSIKENWGNE